MTYAGLKPAILARLGSNVTAGVLVNAIRESCRKFCSDTWYWKIDLADINVTADQQDYDLAATLPNDSEIEAIECVKIDDGVINKNYYGLYELATLRFDENYVPTTDSTDGLSITVILKPSLVDDALPTWIVTQWQEAIRFCVLADISAMPNRPYTDLVASADFLQKYEREVSRCKVAGHTRNVKADVSVTIPNWL
jgi:hypothetical protein